MGTLTYDGTAVEFDDRVLTHLQIIIMNKLRRREPFMMSWKDSPAVGDGRSSIWMEPSIPLYFRFNGSRVPAIDRDWLEKLGESASSPTGLLVTDERGELIYAGRSFRWT